MDVTSTEKQHHISMTEHGSSMSDAKCTPHNANPAIAPQEGDAWATMPKRKPVADALATIGAETSPGLPDAPIVQRATVTPKRAWPLAGGGCLAFFHAQSRARKRLIIGGLAGVVLIALIIGLAVGLTVGKNKHSNLALPTNNGGPYEGDLTYYNPALGSCGYTNTDSDLVCAVSHILFDAASTGSNPNDNPLCGLKLRLRRNGESVDVKVVDRCVGCAETDLDVTEAVFERVAEIDQGRVSVEWSWLEKSPVTVS
ncbi:hypothetical protein N7462_005357 [Penicillium macrosclerotiorum]|uniref:uncharacterized protein n=1 Tax=Penicillium macrosclerotiorum TaxID=303699 RepID=UPI0025493E40|nr:uncharacterized protein N7462_005357 [Penicillium macrosclerotiorum]KAJ5682192.1 hypothetical protein N7462_005357 [Penicillium macrosclerotiorum]